MTNSCTCLTSRMFRVNHHSNTSCTNIHIVQVTYSCTCLTSRTVRMNNHSNISCTSYTILYKQFSFHNFMILIRFTLYSISNHSYYCNVFGSNMIQRTVSNLRERERERERRETKHYPSSSMEEDTRFVVDVYAVLRPISQKRYCLV